jgi:hypothetical protein
VGGGRQRTKLWIDPFAGAHLRSGAAAGARSVAATHQPGASAHALILSFKSLDQRTTGQEMPLKDLKAMEPKEAVKLYTHPANQLIAKT